MRRRRLGWQAQRLGGRLRHEFTGLACEATSAQCSVAMISTYSAPCSSAVRSNADCCVSPAFTVHAITGVLRPSANTASASRGRLGVCLLELLIARLPLLDCGCDWGGRAKDVPACARISNAAYGLCFCDHDLIKTAPCDAPNGEPAAVQRPRCWGGANSQRMVFEALCGRVFESGKGDLSAVAGGSGLFRGIRPSDEALRASRKFCEHSPISSVSPTTRKIMRPDKAPIPWFIRLLTTILLSHVRRHRDKRMRRRTDATATQSLRHI